MGLSFFLIAGNVAQSEAFDARIKLKPSIVNLVADYATHSDWTTIHILNILILAAYLRSSNG